MKSFRPLKNTKFFLGSVIVSMIFCTHAGAITPGDVLVVSDANAGSDKSRLVELNAKISSVRKEVFEIQTKLEDARRLGSDASIIEEMRLVLMQQRKVLSGLKQAWRDAFDSMSTGSSAGFEMISPSSMTIAEFLAEFGGDDLFIVPEVFKDIAFVVPSYAVIPDGDRPEILKSVLYAMGLGIKDTDGVKIVYKIADSLGSVLHVAESIEQLEEASDGSRVAWICSTHKLSSKIISSVLSELYGTQVSFSPLGRKVLILGSKDDLLNLARIFKSLDTASPDIESSLRVFNLVNMQAKDAQRLLHLSCPNVNTVTVGAKNISLDDHLSLQIAVFDTMPKTVFLVGMKDDIANAEAILSKADSEVSGAHEKLIYVYRCKNVKLLPQLDAAVRALLADLQHGAVFASTDDNGVQFFQDAAGPDDMTAIYDGFVDRGIAGNTITDSSTGKLVLLIDKRHMPLVRELLSKMDAYEETVELEVIFFEQVESTGKSNGSAAALSFGLPELAALFGSGMPNIMNSLSNMLSSVAESVLAGTLSMKFGGDNSEGFVAGMVSDKTNANGYREHLSYGYRWLASSKNVEINWSASVLTTNGQVAVFSSSEEGDFQLNASDLSEDDTTVIKDGFKSGKPRVIRARKSGVELKMVPTVFDVNGESHVRLELDLSFDSRPEFGDDSDSIIKRHITNVAQLKDRDFLILSCLNQAYDTTKVHYKKPGLLSIFTGKKQAEAAQSNSTNMYIAIRPKISSLNKNKNSKEDAWRPGDSPEFERLVEAAKYVSNEESMNNIPNVKMLNMRG